MTEENRNTPTILTADPTWTGLTWAILDKPLTAKIMVWFQENVLSINVSKIPKE
jgi:hypothetical protein